jgi:hypothetical protein
MNRGEHLHLLGEKQALERMLAETPDDDAIDRASLEARLSGIEKALAGTPADERAPSRVRVTFRGRPVVGHHGVFTEFAAEAVRGFSDSVAALAASLSAPLAASGPFPNRDQHQLLVTGTAVGSFGFELEEHRVGQLTLDETPVAQALERTQSLLRGAMGTDDELADSAAGIDRRAVDKVRAFLKTLADNDAVCTIQMGDVTVAFTDVGQVRTGISRLSRENLREDVEELSGELQGVLPKARVFEFRVAGTSHVIRGKVGANIADPDALNRRLHQATRITVTVTRVGSGRPQYLLIDVADPSRP